MFTVPVKSHGELFQEPPEPQLPHGIDFIFTISRALGIFPLNKCKTRLSTPLIAYSAISILLSSITCVTYIFFKYDQTLRSAFTVQVLTLVHNLLQMACVVAHYLSFFSKREQYNDILQMLNTTENGGRKLKIARYYVVVGGILLLAYYIPLAIFSKSYQTLTELINEILVQFILTQICGLLELLDIQLTNLTKQLQWSRNVVSLTDKHYRLMAMAKIINSAYCWQILIICTLSFINFVSWMFNGLEILLAENGSLLIFASKILYCSWQLINVYYLARSCAIGVEKAEEFNSELFKIMRESSSLCSNEKLSLYVTMKQTIEFTACGFFPLGYPLVTSIIAAATTYLVILVQFSMPTQSG